MSGQLKRIILDDQNHDDLVGGEGGPGVGPWQAFIPEPGWGTSTLRFRLVPAGLQFDGVQLGNNNADVTVARLGVLPPGRYPARQNILMITVITGSLPYGWGFVVFQPTGDVLVWYSTPGTQFVVNGIIALD